MGLPEFLIGSLIVGGGVQTIGTLSSASQQAAMLRYNAAMQERQAKIAKETGAFTAARARKKGRELISKGIVAAAHGGGLPGEAIETLGATAEEIELEALLAEREGELGYMAGQSAAAISRAQASGALTAGAFGAGATLLGAATDVAYTKYALGGPKRMPASMASKYRRYLPYGP